MAVTTPELPRVATHVDARAARLTVPRPGSALVVALLAAVTYAIFAEGAVGLPQEPRLQVGVALVAAVTAGAWLFTDGISARAPAAAWIGAALLAAFAAWSGLTLIWSVAPDRTWAELNRGVAYTLVVVLGIAAGASTKEALERVATGYLLIALVCALYALGGKVIPGVDAFGIFTFDHTDLTSRLRAPLEYWNALALVCVLAVPVALRIATDMARHALERLGALSALFVLITCVTMSYSRGGLLALTAVVVVMTIIGVGRLRGLAVIGAALVATTPVLNVAFSRPALKDNLVPLSERMPDGGVLGLVMVGSLLGLLVGGWGLLRLEARTDWSPERSASVWRRAKKVGIGLVVVWFLGAASAQGGIGGVVDRAWHDFSKVSEDRVSDPGRISSTNSGNRWVWWQEAGGAWSAKPFGGWGAGSFPVTHKQYRKYDLDVLQPHNTPMQFLAETGVVGAALGLGGIAMLLYAGLLAVRAAPRGRRRDMSAALFAGGIAYALHGLYDWDWDFPGVTVPALLMLGVLAGSMYAPGVRSPRNLLPGHLSGHSSGGARAIGLVGMCLLLGVVMVSAWLPQWADSKSDDALDLPANASPARLASAASEADTASRLDPTALTGLLASASVAQARGRLVEARQDLLDAVDRQPYSTQAWQRLLQLTLTVADRRGARAASDRLLVLDPLGKRTRQLVGEARLFEVPAASSPTAGGTPLSPKAVPLPRTGQRPVATPGTPAPTTPAQPPATGTGGVPDQAGEARTGG